MTKKSPAHGPLDTIARFGHDLPRPAAVLVGEPTLMQVADAHKSVATYRTIVHGHEAHSAKPYLGASAVATACELVAELYRFGEELKAAGDPSGRFDPPCSTVHVGIIHGGTARNILAKRCAFHWEFRGLPNVPQDLALEASAELCGHDRDAETDPPRQQGAYRDRSPKRKCRGLRPDAGLNGRDAGA